MSVFPFIMYDTDVGFGYGGRAKFISYLSQKESFDFVIFNSTKGERWYGFNFSIPDAEIRQGKKYPFSFDLRAEYQKYLKYYFYGIGGGSREEDQTEFIYEQKKLRITIGKGFSPHFVVEVSYFLKNVHYIDPAEDRPFTDILGAVGEQFSPFVSLVVRYDTSDSQIHPQKGMRLIFQNDWASRFFGNKNASFYRFSLDFRKYTHLFGQRDVLAFRTLVQKISGEEIPLFEMLDLGGNSEMTAMRGYKMNRFVDKGKFLLNTEYRFPLLRKLGGTVFLDGGLLWPSWSEIKFNNIAVDVGWGLRYYLQNFVVRFDMGLSSEDLGIYFNFGHVF
jgi:outer membrane protein assembly factor BamA